jgi:uncharacterized protein
VGKKILEYQKVFNNAIDKLKKNESVLAVMVFGSMVTGDLWEQSDIDLFVIHDDNNMNLKNIYTEINNIPIHIKLISKNKFLQPNEKNLKGGFIHRIIASSRLVFSKDMEITSKYDIGRYYPDIDRKKWNIVYLGNTLNSEELCKKYLETDGLYTAYVSAIKTIEEFSKLYVNYAGYMISKNVVSVAMSLNEKFKKVVDLLMFNNTDDKTMKDSIIKVLEYIDRYINQNIRNLTDILISYMKRKDCFLSSEEIKNDVIFKDYDICMEEVLDKLWRKNIIKRQKMDYKIKGKIVLFKENVYFI